MAKVKEKQIGMIVPVSLWAQVKAAADRHEEHLHTFVPRLLKAGLKAVGKPKKK